MARYSIERALDWIIYSYEIGTVAIFRRLRQHWLMRSHPIYCADAGFTASYWIQHHAELAMGEPRTPVLVWVLVALLIAVIVFSVPGIVLFGIGIYLFGMTWIGYILIIRRTSLIIVEEHEKQRWETLLMIPYKWEELILAKLAASLRAFYLGWVLWLQAGFLVAIFCVAIRQETTQINYFVVNNPVIDLPGALLAYIPLLIVVLIVFTISRLQDFILISIIGMLISLVSKNKQIATVGAVFAGIGYLLASVFLIAVAIPHLRIEYLFFGPELFTTFAATGPTGSLLVGMPIQLAAAGVIAIIFIREMLARILFGWLIKHLSER